MQYEGHRGYGRPACAFQLDLEQAEVKHGVFLIAHMPRFVKLLIFRLLCLPWTNGGLGMLPRVLG